MQNVEFWRQNFDHNVRKFKKSFLPEDTPKNSSTKIEIEILKCLKIFLSQRWLSDKQNW